MAAVGCTEPDPRYCESSAACDGGVCDPVKHYCVAGDAGVGGDGGGDGGADAGCGSSAQCAETADPVCRNGRCVPCALPGDGGAGDDVECALHGALVCGAGGACVQCRDASQCGGKTPVCKASACVPCAAHADCPSLLCNGDGSCEPEANVLYVDRDHCMGQLPTGTRAAPFCEIQPAVGKGKPIRVLGSAMGGYAGVDLTGNQSATIVGPGLGASPPARIGGGNVPGVNVGGTTSTVLVDGVEVTAGLTDGIACASTQLGPTLTVTRTWVHGVAGIGISSSKCNLVLDRDRVGPMNAAGGIVLSGTQYKVWNTIVAENSGGPGVQVTAASTGQLVHLTIAKNQNGQMPAGLDCGLTSATIEESIVWGNGRPIAGSQLFGTCKLSSVDIDENATGTNVTSDNPLFDASYYLQKPSKCIDALATSPLDHDIAGTPRPSPKGGKSDLGAFELPQ